MNENLGFVTGDELMLRTDDGGQTWDDVYSESQSVVWGMHFFDDLNGLGNTSNGTRQILRTIDGGETWLPTTGYFEDGVRSMSVVDENLFYIAGESGLLQVSHNGGDDWQGMTIGPQQDLNDGLFVSDQVGIAVGDSATILRTIDGGINWARVPIPDREVSLASVKKSENGSHLWVACFDSTILRSIDDGATWDRFTVYENAVTSNIFFHNDTLGWATDYYNENIFRTINSGESWEVMNSTPMPRYQYDIHFIDSLNGFLTTRDSLFETTDAGYTWNSQDIPEYRHGRFKNMYFMNSRRGWLLGNGELLSTSDSGDTWQYTEYIDQTSEQINSMIALDSLNIMAVASRGRIITSTNGGQYWEAYYQAFHDGFSSIFQGPGESIWLTGPHGCLMSNIPRTTIPVSIEPNIPSFLAQPSFELKVENYPNPFNGSCTISYLLPFDSNVTIIAYDLLGRQVWRKNIKNQTSGKRHFQWDGRDYVGHLVSSGIYIIQVQAGNLMDSRKMLVVN